MPTPVPSAVDFALRLVARLMEGHRLDAVGAAEKSGFDDETARRYLKLIRSRIPGVRLSGGRKHTFSFDWPETAQVRPAALLSLMLARALLAFLRGSTLEKELREVVRDHQSRVAAGDRVPPPDISRMFFVKSTMLRPLGIDGGVFDILADAIFSQRRVSARYGHFRGTKNEIVFEPFTIIFGDHGIYCYGRVTTSTDPKYNDSCRLMNLERFEEPAILPDSFIYPDGDYHPAKLFEHCWGIFLPGSDENVVEEIEVAFDPGWAAYLGHHRWHEHQAEPAIMQDKRILVRFRLYPTHDFVRWLRGLGKAVEVLRPPGVKAWVESCVDPI